MKFGEAVRELARRKRVSQRGLAQAAGGLSPATVQGVYKSKDGARVHPSTLRALALGLGITVDEFNREIALLTEGAVASPVPVAASPLSNFLQWMATQGPEDRAIVMDLVTQRFCPPTAAAPASLAVEDGGKNTN